MTPEILDERRLSPADDAAIAALLARCFATDFGGRSCFQTRPTWRHVMRTGSGIVAHLAVQLRAVRLGEEMLTIAGIADVATDPAWRGQGLARRLLQLALTEARDSLASHALLFGTARLYPAAGFRGIANPLTYVEMTGARTSALVRTKREEHLQVLELSSRPWNETAPLDLLGGLF